MTILQELLGENVTVAHSIATGADGPANNKSGSLFNGGVMRRGKNKKKMMSDAYRLDPSKLSSGPRSNWGWRIIGEMMDSSLKGQSQDSTFDPADVMSKLRDAEKQVDTEDDTVPFGLEDEDGKVVKVYVRAEQADEFEDALATMLAGEDKENDDDEETDESEIAEVLFKLKDKFDIVDVQWPDIEGDEEQEQTMGGEEAAGGMGDEAGGEMMPPGEGGEMPPGEGGEAGGEMGMDAEGGEGDLEGEGEMDMEADGGAESTLQQVIDMMKKDAEARTAEAEARAAEAKAKEAEANANASASKVRQEEQVMDADAYEKDKKSQKTEVENLSKIARMKHDQAGEAETRMASDEDEEELMRNRRMDRDQQTAPISVQKLAAELLGRLRGSHL